MLPPVPAYFPDDILFDVFLALDRNELEKCLLVSRAWNTLLSSRCSILPLRSFVDLYYNGPQWKIRYERHENKSLLVAGEITLEVSPFAKALQHCIFGVVRQDHHPGDIFLTQVALLVDACGQKIRTKIFEPHVKSSELYKVMLEKYIEAEKILIQAMRYERLKPLLMNGCALRERTFPWPVHIRGYYFPRGEDDTTALVELISKSGEAFENLELIQFGELNYFGFKMLYEVRSATGCSNKCFGHIM